MYIAIVQGVILNACIRDSAEIQTMPLGVKAIGTCPRKSAKRDPGELNVPVRFAGVTINPGLALCSGSIKEAQSVHLFIHGSATSI